MKRNYKKTQTYTKIDTLYKRYRNLGKAGLPDKAWMAFQNKIIEGDFSSKEIEYLYDKKFHCFSKIDGTNTKIVFYPSIGEIFYGGKTDDADLSMHDKIMPGICERILPKLREMFPPEKARFVPETNDKRQTRYFAGGGETEIYEDTDLKGVDENDLRMVRLKEFPVYIYGELFGAKIQKGGGNYSAEPRFSAFDICQQGWWLPIGRFTEMCNDLGLDIAPYYGEYTVKEAEGFVRDGFRTLVDNPVNPDCIEEGIVARPVVPLKDEHGNRIIVKIKHKDYAELDAAIRKVGEGEYEKFRAWYEENRETIENL